MRAQSRNADDLLNGVDVIEHDTMPAELMDAAPAFDNALHVMEIQGGSFVRSLAACYYAADSANKARLREAFKDYFDRYEERYRATLQQRRARA